MTALRAAPSETSPVAGGIKEYLTAAEIAAEGLPDLPGTKSAVIRYAERLGWNEHPLARKRAGRGGGMEYPVSLLPVLAQVAYRQKYLVVAAPEPATEAAPETGPALSARAAQERDARLAIVNAYQRFTRTLRLGHATHVQVFSDKYNAGSIQVDAWVRERVPSISKRSLIRWVSAKRDKKTAKLAVDRGAARKGTGVLDVAEGGRLQWFILAQLADAPHLSAEDVREQCRSEFGDRVKTVSKGVETLVDMPPTRTFQHTIKRYKVERRAELTKLTNPDHYRSTMKLSGTGTLRHITEPNQLWQIDASPVDALCTDGRHSVYCCIDIATRRMILSLSRTPRASAVALLIRKAIMAWGVPKVVQTDNGSDFTAEATTRLFLSLDVEPDICDAYSPEQKGHVERAIRTFQHKVGPHLPGYIGHSVADRKIIENRKSLAKRRGETEAETFSVSLTGPELQRYIDDWVEVKYQHRRHAGLKRRRDLVRRTPFEAAQASTAPIRTVDARALDLLLMPVARNNGQCTVTKFGVRINNYHYASGLLMPGRQVFVRMDPNDLGRVYVFAQDGGDFIAVATCPELAGIHPQSFYQAERELQAEVIDRFNGPIKEEIKRIAKGPSRIERALEVGRRDMPNVIPLPKREVAHSTPQIAAALDAMSEPSTKPLDARAAAEHRRLIEQLQAEEEAATAQKVEAIYARRLAEIETARTAHLPKDEKVVALPEAPKQRYRRYLATRAAIAAGGGTPADGMWVKTYEQSAEYRSQAALHEDFGDAYLS